MLRRLVAVFLAVMLAPPALADPPVVLAAASLQESMTEAADAWAAKGHEKPRLAFAGTPALARQIIAGAPADIFVSADADWADTLDRQHLFRPGTRANLLSNRLVIVVPTAERRGIARVSQLPAWLGARKLALADPASVPAGRYARSALEHSHVWAAVQPNIVGTENVRGALTLVARGTAGAGFVYATDALVESGVRVAGRVPARLHAPIDYVIAIPAAATSPDAAGFRAFLLSTEGQRIFIHRGFLPPHR